MDAIPPQLLNIRLGRRRTSVRLERCEREVLDAICASEGLNLHEFCSRAVSERRERSATARIRAALLDYCFGRLGRGDGLNRPPRGVAADECGAA